MNNDLISRNDLEKFKILPFDKASYDDTEINAAYQNGWNDAIDRIIDNAPTVEILPENVIEAHTKIGYERGFNDGYAKCVEDNERPQGKWIKVINPDTNTWTGGLKCSECGRGCVQASMYFCSNCGAKMQIGGAE